MNILIVKPSSFGDIVQANPVLAALKASYPGARISWLVFDAWQDVLSFFPEVDERIVWRKKGGLREYLRVLKTLRRRKFDLAIDLQGLLRSGLLTALSGARRKAGVPGMKECSGFLVQEPFPESRTMNAVYRSLETVRFLTGKRDEARFTVAVPAAAEAEARALLASKGIDSAMPLIGLVPFARGGAKEWPAGHYKELMQKIAESHKDHTIVLLGDASGKGRINGQNTIDMCGETSLLQLGGILKQCRVVVGADTGPTHLAAALGVPAVVLFGGSDARETAPVTKNAVIVKKDFACAPCRGRNTCSDFPCLRGITAAEVFQAMQRWIR